MTDHIRSAEEIHIQLSRGTIALAYLAELAEHVAEYDSAKQVADAVYAGKVNDAAYALVSRISGTTRRANNALDAIGNSNDDDDDNDDI